MSKSQLAPPQVAPPEQGTLTLSQIHFSSGSTKISVTHVADDSYRVDVNSGHNEFTIQATVPLILFSPTNLLAYHKAARDVVHRAIEAGQLAPQNLRWMRHRSGDDGDPMLVLCPIPPFGGTVAPPFGETIAPQTK